MSVKIDEDRVQMILRPDKNAKFAPVPSENVVLGAEDRRRCPQDGAKMPQDGLKMAPDGPRCAVLGPS